MAPNIESNITSESEAPSLVKMDRGILKSLVYKVALRCRKMDPRWLKMVSRWCQDESSMGQDGLEIVQDSPKQSRYCNCCCCCCCLAVAIE